MCGRTACTLDPDQLKKSCSFHNKSGKVTEPSWRNPPGGQKYYTSYNVCPGSHTPVMLSSQHKTSSDETESEESEFVIQPMRWGLVPSWHTGDPKKFQLNTNNARSDGILQKNMFKKPLEAGRRCVVLADGYFEWQTKDGVKQPYFIYFPQDGVKQPEGSGITKPLTMAGLFDEHHSTQTGEHLYSYSIITVDAHDKVKWIHHRMPAILNGEDEIRRWLDFGRVPLKEAIELIRPVDVLTCHPVSTAVNSSSNKADVCVQPINLEKEKKKREKSAVFMKAWLSGGSSSKRKNEDPPAADTDSKQLKTDSAHSGQ